MFAWCTKLFLATYVRKRYGELLSKATNYRNSDIQRIFVGSYREAKCSSGVVQRLLNPSGHGIGFASPLLLISSPYSATRLLSLRSCLRILAEGRWESASLGPHTDIGSWTLKDGIDSSKTEQGPRIPLTLPWPPTSALLVLCTQNAGPICADEESRVETWLPDGVIGDGNNTQEAKR